MTFGEALRTSMVERGINATTIAMNSGVSKSYISKLLSGDFKDPTWLKACAIIDALGMKPSEFQALMERDHA